MTEAEDRIQNPPVRGGGSTRKDARAAAAQRWVGEHGDVLWRFVLAKVRKAEVAEEVVQETIVAALEAFERFGGQSSERTWLLGIAAHKIADHYRRAARTLHREPESAEDAPCGCDRCRALFAQNGSWARVPEAWPGADNDEEERLLHLNILRACIDALPPGQREAIWQRELLGASSADVCKNLGLTATNLWTRLHRARSALRSCLEQALGDGEKSWP